MKKVKVDWNKIATLIIGLVIAFVAIIMLIWFGGIVLNKGQKFCALEIDTDWFGGSPIERIKHYEIVDCPLNL